MEFMLIFNEPEGLATPNPDCMVVMGKFAQGLVREKKLRRGFPLEGAAEAATVRVRDGQPVVKDGPFAETKEQIAGVWIIDAADRAEVDRDRAAHPAPERRADRGPRAGRTLRRSPTPRRASRSSWCSASSPATCSTPRRAAR